MCNENPKRLSEINEGLKEGACSFSDKDSEQRFFGDAGTDGM